MKVDVNFEMQSPQIKFKSNDMGFDMNFKNFQTVTDAETYEGDYEVTPKTTAQVLDTGQKFMAEDVTVHKIPFHKVSNLNGGNTITIGKDV